MQEEIKIDFTEKNLELAIFFAPPGNFLLFRVNFLDYKRGGFGYPKLGSSRYLNVPQKER
jgi:hypothetical protein